MIEVWILVMGIWSAGYSNPVPPMADLASCERVREAFVNNIDRRDSKCVQVFIPAPSDKAYFWMKK